MTLFRLAFAVSSEKDDEIPGNKSPGERSARRFYITTQGSPRVVVQPREATDIEGASKISHCFSGFGLLTGTDKDGV